MKILLALVAGLLTLLGTQTADEGYTRPQPLELSGTGFIAILPAAR